MKKIGILVSIVLLVLAASGYVFYAEQGEETEFVSSKETIQERPRARTKEEIRSRMTAHLEATKEKAVAMRRKIKTMGPQAVNSYTKGQAEASLRSITVLDKILDKGKRDDALSQETSKSVENALSEREGSADTKIENADCISGFCRVVLTFENDKSMDGFLMGIEQDPLKQDRHRFLFTQSKITVEADKPLPASIPMETRFYFSNTDVPLPMDEELQEEPNE